MADYLPKFLRGTAVTFTASTAVTGGRLVQVSGDRLIGAATAGSRSVIGVAGFDAELGDSVTVYTRDGGVHPLTASAAIATGARVAVAAGGTVVTASEGDDVLGTTLTAATAPGQIVEVLF